MQTLQTPALKRFTLGHVASMAIALTIVVSILTAVTTLSITGDLPGQQSNAASAPAVAVRATQQAQAQRFYAHKEARQDAIESQAAALAARASAEQRYLEMEQQEFADFMRRND